MATTYKYLNIEDAIKYYHENCIVPLQNQVEGIGRRTLAQSVAIAKRPVKNNYYTSYTKESEWTKIKLDDVKQAALTQYSASYVPEDSPSGGPGILDSIFTSYITGLQIWRPIPTSVSSENSWQIWQRARLPSGNWEEWHCVNGLSEDELNDVLSKLN